MGLYDRDYYRQQRPVFGLAWPRSVTVSLILINAAIYLLDYLFLEGRLAERWLHVSVGTLTDPRLWWQFLTYGFMHDRKPQHIVLNMLALWFFGRPVEERYGKWEFLRLYLAMLVFGSVVWAVIGRFGGADPREWMIGASGAVTGIVILFALHWPHVRVALWFVLPLPAWVFGVLVVVLDAWGAVQREQSSRVAYTVHLAGAAFALTYFQFGWNLARLRPRRLSWRWFRWRPSLRLHAPEEEDERFSREVDRILQKISLEGEASLTRSERRTLRDASRRYQQRQQKRG